MRRCICPAPPSRPASLGMPDVGLFTLTELVAADCSTSRPASASPLIVDADTGFGDAVNVERTIVELERPGRPRSSSKTRSCPSAAATCPANRWSPGSHVRQAARRRRRAGRRVPPVIIARTDARGVDDFDAAIERAKRYLDAGADWIFPEALATHDEFERSPMRSTRRSWPT